MNKLFGFFKEKLKEVKDQNKQDLQNILNAFDGAPYSKSQMLGHLQSIKTNYLEWSIMIANQASTGLYFTQLHNKSSSVKKVRSFRDTKERKEKLAMVLDQMKSSLGELKEIQGLSGKWVSQINFKVERVGDVLAQDRKQKKERQRLQILQTQQRQTQQRQRQRILIQQQQQNLKNSQQQLQQFHPMQITNEQQHETLKEETVDETTSIQKKTQGLQINQQKQQFQQIL